MLLEPGPLPLFTQAQIPLQGPPSGFQWIEGERVAALDHAAAEMQIAQWTMAAGSVNELEQGPVQELAAAAIEHANQRTNQDGSIATVANNAHAQAGELAGNANEVTRDINAGIPAAPTIPPDGYGANPLPPGVPRVPWDDVTRYWVRNITNDDPSADELLYARRFNPDVDALRAWILAGMPLEGGPAPPPPPPPPPPGGPDYAAWDAGVNALFRELGGRDAFDGEINFARRFYDNLGRVREWIVAGTPTDWES